MKRTLILGGGFGGLAVATELRRRLGADHEIVVIDRHEHFVMGLRKLWALVGLGSLEEGRRPRAGLDARGVRFVRANISAIDPGARRATTDAGGFDADFLVVALGADLRPDLVPGLAENAHDLYDVAATRALAGAIARFDGGRIAIVVAGAPYKCPPAPYECAMLLDTHLAARGVRSRTTIEVATIQPILMPNAGREGSAWVGRQLDERGIAWRAGRKLQRVEAGRVVFDDGALEADLLIAVPPHRPPAVVKASGLTGDGEWIAVDPGTLATKHERVWAIGDATQIKLANGLPLPKAGLFAELEGRRVAAAIAAEALGAPAPPVFDGRGYCFIELGRERAARVEGEFYASPEPRIALGEPSSATAAAKRHFETERLTAWFGA